MVEKYIYHPRLGCLYAEAGHAALFSVNTDMVKHSDYAALEARLAEAETHRDKNRETAISSQQWVNQLEARCRDLTQDNVDVAKINIDLIKRNRELEAALAWVIDNFNTFAQPPEHLKGIVDAACLKAMTADEDAVRMTASAKETKGEQGG